MKIDGKKYLDSNNYSRIIIDLLQKDFSVNVKQKDKFETLKNSIVFSDNLKGLSDENKVIEIVNYFLDNSKIVDLRGRESLPNLQGWYSTVKGDNGRLLALKLNSSKLSNKIVKLVTSKYEHDRYNHFLENDISSIYLTSTHNTRYEGDSLYLKISKKCGIYYVDSSEKNS